MKSLFLFVVLLCPAVLLAIPENPKRIAPYSVTYEADQSVAETDGKVKFRCYLHADYDPGSRLLRYGLNDSEETITLDESLEGSVAAVPGTYRGQFYFSYVFEEIEAEAIEILPGVLTVITLHFTPADRPKELKKPVIYCYPEKETEMKLNVIGSNALSFTYPQLPEDGWKFTAHPDGTLSIGEKTYPYLFWEMEHSGDAPVPAAEGFYVSGNGAADFLEKQLTALGFNDREKADFITFWGPQMAVNEWMLVQFLINRECDPYAVLEIEPSPDNVNRIYMLWRPLAKGFRYEGMTEPVLPMLDRSGFDILEWGGMQLDGEFPEFD